MKNPTPRTIAMVAALVSAACAWILARFVFDASFSAMQGLFFFVLTFAIVYAIVVYLVGDFIYKKIKIIYQSILSEERFRKGASERIDMGQDVIGEVNREVNDWKRNRSEEMEEMRQTETFRKEFLGNVSHELKTPIFNIQGYIHTLLDGGVEDKEINIQYLQRAARSVDRLCLIVDDLESISKFESGELILEQRTFDIADLVRDVIDSVELQARERNITLALKEDSHPECFVFADKERIRQVLVNLLVNSIKYGKAGGKTQVGIYDLDDNILVEVTDNGIGIEPQHIPRLFERFYRVDKSRSREQGGTGLGLSIVKHILEAHNQTISVRSSYGVGTTFSFALKKA